MQLDGMAIFGDKNKEETILKETSSDGSKTTSVFADSVRFEEMRMEARNERSQMRDQLTNKISSPDITAEEKKAAYEEMDELIKRESAEALMELHIKELGYPDAFVRKDNGKVDVTVLSVDEGHSAKMADEITQYIMTSWEDAREVQVVFME